MTINEIIFTEEDCELFYTDDMHLKAKALEHSVLPKMKALLNETIGEISRVYNVDVFELSGTSYSPHPRSGTNKVKYNFEHVMAAITAKRLNNGPTLWKGVSYKKNNEPVKILEFSLNIVLTKEFNLEVNLQLCNRNTPGQAISDYTKFLESHKKYQKNIDTLTNLFFNVEYHPIFHNYYLTDGKKSVVEILETMNKKNEWILWMIIGTFKLPADTNVLRSIIRFITIFYPIYEAYLRIASNQIDIFPERLEQIRKYIYDVFSNDKNEVEAIYNDKNLQIDQDKLKEAADKKIRIMPGKRFQVLSRDKHRCVSCGISAKEDGVKLHIDHIIPRSLGGTDDIDNLQTLCWECNIGKSNKDDTNLREQQNIH